MNARARIDIDVLKAKAAEQVHGLCAELLRGGEENCGFWECGNIAGDPGQSLKVNLEGPMRGLWTDFAVGKGMPGHSGNMVQLVTFESASSNHSMTSAKGTRFV